jgi:drug/metabolite transporter (DMT)-like permease
MLLAAPVFIVVAWRESQRGAPLTPRDWGTVTVLGLFGYYGASMLDFYGLLYISAGLERLVLFIYPTLTLLIGWLAQGGASRRAKSSPACSATAASLWPWCTTSKSAARRQPSRWAAHWCSVQPSASRST